MLREGEFSGYEAVIPSSPLEMRDAKAVRRVVEEVRPEHVIHLAAQSFVPASFTDPHTTFDVNLIGTLNLLEALRAQGLPGRLIYVSSGDVYGTVAVEDLPVTERQAVRPLNPYAVSKASAELLCHQWLQTSDLDIVIARPFNHIGPGQSERFVVSDFARQVAGFKAGRGEPVLVVGSTDTTRDMTDVRDVVGAYMLLLADGDRGDVYNICSGSERSIGAILEKLIAIAQVSCRIVQDPARVRAREQKRMCGSFEKLKRRTGWKPTIDFEQSLADILQYWNDRLANG